MPLVKFSCPKCNATLKPAKPVPEGKSVKCPKCQQMFKAGETAAPKAETNPAEEEEAGTYGILKDEAEEKKKAEEEEARQRKLKKKKRKKEDDEDEDEDEDEEEEEKEKGDDILDMYLATVKSKDPRGPAQETIGAAANWLMFTGLQCFFGWIFYFVIFLIPIVFPTYEKDANTAKEGVTDTSNEDKSQDKAKKFKLTKEMLKDMENSGKLSADTLKKLADRKNALMDKEYTYETFKAKIKDKDIDIDKEEQVRLRKYMYHLLKMDIDVHWWSADSIVDEDNEVWAIPTFLAMLALGLAQGGLICYGAFKMQNLESYQWCMVGCIVAIVPLVTVPVWVLTTFGTDLLNMALDAGWEDFSWCFGLIFLLWGPLVGGLGLNTLLKPKVKAGFEYKGD